MLKRIYFYATSQLKDMAERMPPGVYDTENIRPPYLPNGVHYPDANGEGHLRSDSVGDSFLASTTALDSTTINGTQNPTQLLRELTAANGRDDHSDTRLPNGGGFQAGSSSLSEAVVERESGSFGDGENGMKSRNSALVANGNQVEAEGVEQYEPGVYITLVALQDGTRDLKRVRFRYIFYVLLYVTIYASPKYNSNNFFLKKKMNKKLMIYLFDIKSRVSSDCRFFT